MDSESELVLVNICGNIFPMTQEEYRAFRDEDNLNELFE